ncbi:29 kDa ribonucleoprotein A, chloroplastic [Prosopis cineraria]|uniref:29 kDa ribonucleoprotein A, chloroplastic n=1 Tax=Prosopis cineraria TaxID=364024 RepID=UPI00241042F7|nr:29 kDa ribonucleoprotein A, chloroplastic [Prosopis cineraria]
MATLESGLTVLGSFRCSNKHSSSAKPFDWIKLNVSTSLFPISYSCAVPSILSSIDSSPRHCFELCSALKEAATEEKPQQTQETNIKKKLCVFNLPWSLSAVDIKNLFGQCGTVTDVEIIRSKDGKSRGFAFITMASGEEAEAAIDKFDSHELSGRIIRVELAKRFKKPPPPAPPKSLPPGETSHKIYASNLAWKARSSHLRAFFTENFKSPVSARVVFDSPNGRSAGYGFVSFATRDEAEAAISSLDGKELMGRPLRLKFSERTVTDSGDEKVEELGSDDEPAEPGKAEGQGSNDEPTES